MLKAAKAYLSTQVTTASQGDLLLMLYDTAIKHLRLAIEKMRASDFAAKGVLISKAISIISELQESLNKDRGGEISKNLLQLYFFCNTRLLQANLKMKPEMVEEVIVILSGLRQAFAEILPTQQGVASFSQPGAACGAEAQPVADIVPPAASPVDASVSVAVSPSVDTPVAEAASAASQDEAVPVPEVAALEAAPMIAPVNPVRFRAASAYANSR